MTLSVLTAIFQVDLD